MPAHPSSLPARSRALAASILLAAAPPDLPLILLPSTPDASVLAQPEPAADTTRALRPLRVDVAGLAGLGVGACALWALGTAAPDAAPHAMRTPNRIGFALAGTGAIATLASLLLPGQPPVAGVRAYLMIGPGGAGVTVAARF
jgi:hypothetical protein